VSRAWQRVRAVAAKGPEHWWNLARWHAAQQRQRRQRVWRAEAIGEAAFFAQWTATTPERAAHHLRTRAEPRLRAVTPPDAAARDRVLAEAEAVCAHTFHFRGQPPVTFNGEIDWQHCPHGNVDWMWELNRHSYFITLGRAFVHTGDRRYRDTFRELLLHWMARNPPGVEAPNWASALEVAYRLNVWTWAFYFFRAELEDESLLALARGLWWHGSFLAANLEIASPNNHLLLEAKALALAGLLFPEFGGAREWQRRGLALVWREVRRQVHADGVHFEQAVLYHQIIASELLECLIVLERNSVPTPPDIRERFALMLEFERALRKPDGTLPLLGDSALEDSYVRFDALAGGAALLRRPELASGSMDELTRWLVGDVEAVQPAPKPDSRAFRVGGYCVMRAPDRYLVFDCGPFGAPHAPGHGHADALSLELFALGRTLLLDPGVYSYHLGDDWRNYFRGTRAHNTVLVDEADQSELAGQWGVNRAARTILRAWASRADFDLAAGEHDGYTRLAQPITHRRQIVFVKPEYWIVLDQLLGAGEHHFDVLWHCAPDATVEVYGGLSAVTYPDGSGLLIAPATMDEVTVICGSEKPIQGWASYRSGEKQLAPVVRVSRVAPAPVEFVTVLYPCRKPGQQSLSVSFHRPTRDKARVVVKKPNGVDEVTLRHQLGSNGEFEVQIGGG
jgi:hypothetical protein